MSQERKFSDDFAVVGDVANGTSILIDRHTGLQVQPSEPGEDLVQQLKSERHAWIFAIALAEFVNGTSPRGAGSNRCLHAAKRWFCEIDPERLGLATCDKQLANAAFTAGWLGVKVGDPYAAILMACFALTKTDPFDVVQRVVRNSHIMHVLREHRGYDCLRGDQRQLVSRLLDETADEFREHLVDRWMDESKALALTEWSR